MPHSAQSLSLLKPASHTHWLIGVDEAGRGCLAGPVVAAAVLLPTRYDLPGLTDSKALTAPARAALAPAIRQQCLAWSLGLAWQQEVDERNILQATFWAMARALRELRPTALAALPGAQLRIDGNKIIPEPIVRACVQPEPGTPLPAQKAIVDGDALVPCISAASILAKTFRDHIMEKLHKRYPVYGFDQHKGYGTKVHLAALRAHGPCRLHRLTFAGVLPPKPKPAQGSLL